MMRNIFAGVACRVGVRSLLLSLCLSLSVCWCTTGLLTAASPSQDTALLIQLEEQVLMHRAQVYLKDIAQSTLPAAEWQALADIPVQRLAGVGPYTISARRIRTLLRSKGVRGNIRIRGSVSVSRALRVISAQEIFAAAQLDMNDRIQIHTDNMSAQDAAWKHIVITEKRAATALSVCDETTGVRIEADPLTAALYGDVPYRVRVFVNDRESARSLVIVHVAVEREVLAFSRDFKKGHEIGYGDIEKQVITVTDRNQQNAPLVDAVVGQILRVRGVKGAVVYQSMLRRPYAVHGGQLVDVRYRRAQFQLTVRGTVQSTASIGEDVKVRTVDGGRTLLARVIAPDVVEIR